MISVVTVFHQRRDLAVHFADELRRATDVRSEPVEFLFGDNQSDDGTRDYLISTAPSVGAHLSCFAENLGYAKGNNALARQARGEVLVFLNYDVSLPPGWFKELVRPFAERRDLGIVGNVQLSVRSQVPDHAGIFFNSDGSPFHFRPSLSQLVGLDLLPVPAVTGACLAIRREVFETIGGFHEGYLNSYEDIELCLRARELGYEVAVSTKSIIWHYIGASPGRQDREEANARLFRTRCGDFARRLARFSPPDLTPSDQVRMVIPNPTTNFETLQVFLDYGAGYTEEKSTVHLYRRGRWNRIEIALSSDAGAVPRAIRLDPGRSIGRIRFGGMALKQGRSRASICYLRGRQLRQSAEVSGTARLLEDSRALLLESTGADPQVSISLVGTLPHIAGGSFLDVWLWADKPGDEAPDGSDPRKTILRWPLRLPLRRVLVDLVRMSPGGLNGGVKVFVLELLDAIARRHRFRLSIHAIATPEVCREIAVIAPRLTCHGVTSANSPDATIEAGRADVLYAPLGFSSLSRPGLPQVSLLVDFLHRDIPKALPDGEIAAREKWMVETLCWSDVLQCNSRFVVERLHHHYGSPAASTLVVYNAVGQTKRWSGRRHNGTPYYFFPANDWPHKNHARLLEAYAEYRSRQSAPWDLKLSGHFADPGRITAIIDRLGLDTCTEVLGHLPVEDFNRVFSQAGALVFPSRYEGFGIPVLEAFRLEVPVICSSTASLPEIGGDACGYFDPEDTESIAAAMSRIAADSAWRTTLIAAGQRRARTFDLAKEADKLARAFIDVARR